MAYNFELITQYATKGLISQFAMKSKTEMLELKKGDGTGAVEFEGKRGVKIPIFTQDGLGDYDRLNGFESGDSGLDWQTFQMGQDRGKEFPMDKMDNEESAGIWLVNQAKEFNEKKVVRELDAYRFSKMVSYIEGSSSYRVVDLSTSDAQDTILKELNTAIKWMTNHEIEKEDLFCFISPDVNQYLAETKELVKTSRVEEFSGKLKTEVREYNGVPLIEVPQGRFFTNIIIDKKNGFRTSENSKDIQFLLVAKGCAIPVKKYEFSKIYSSNDCYIGGIDGYKYSIRIYHDLFVPKTREVGIYACVSTTCEGANATLGKVEATSKAGSATGTTKFVNISVYPADKAVRAFAWTTTKVGLGASVDLDTLTNEITVDKSTFTSTDFTVANGTKGYIVAYDKYGLAVAVSSEITAVSK